MLYIIQKDKNFKNLDIELEVLKQEIKKQKYIHEYWEEDIIYWSDSMQYPANINIKEVVPVGSIEFVSQYLKKVHNIDNMNPIEIPKILRTEEFLCREYNILTADEIPRTGYYFIKDASQLKQFSYCGKMEYFFYDEIFDEPKRNDTRIRLNKDHLYQVSEVVDILSEYRVIIHNDEIKAIQFYDGKPTIMPTIEEINKLEKAVSIYCLDKSRPRAYTIDIAIIRKNNAQKRDLMILEMHPFACLGTYGYVGSDLPNLYRDGLDWYIKENNKIIK